MLAVTSFGFSGAASADEGGDYVLTLSGTGPGASSVDHWTINWGDGNVQTVPGSPASVTHSYADGAADHTISASVTNASGTFPARPGAAVNDGDLDSTFGPGGTGKVVLTSFGYLTATAPLANGKFIGVGTRYIGTDSRFSDFLVARFNADGSLDTAFGPDGDGTTHIDFGYRDDYGNSVLVLPDGRILVGGRSFLAPANSFSDFALARLNANGSLDDGGLNDSTPGDQFGTAGLSRRHVGDFAHNYLTSLALQGDGKVVAGGYSKSGSIDSSRFALARFNMDGTPDSSFAGGGSVETDFPDSVNRDRAWAMAVQPDNKIILAGESAPTTIGNLAAVRYTAGGQVDTTFGSSGFFVSDPLSGGIAYSVALQSDGNVLLGGRKHLDANAAGDWAIVRLTSAGGYDTTFGSAGTGLVSTVMNVTANSLGIRALSVQADGRVLAAGAAMNPSGTLDFGLARYNADGSLDLGFGDGGRVVTDINNASNWIGDMYNQGGAGGMTVFPNGNVVLAGGDGGGIAYLARYNGVAPPKVVHVNNVAPTLSLGGDASAAEGSSFHLQLVRGDAGSDTLAQWTVNWGDGSAPRTVANGQTFADHTYADSGSYTITATATDEDGTYTITPRTVQVANVAPTLTVGGASSVNEGADYSLSLSSSDVAPDTVGGWTVDWGDGSAVQSVTAAQAQSPVVHRYGDDGSYTVSVTATDEDGTYSAAPKTVAVANVAPTLSLAGASSAAEGAVYTLTLSRTDPGSDALSQWVVNWGDGSAAQTVTGGVTAVDHVYADNASRTITATATDEDGTYTVPNKSIQVTNVAPQVTLGGPASVQQGATYGLTFSATDPGTDTITGWTVNWGDGGQNSFGAGASGASHAYAATGSYTVTVSVTDEDGTHSGTTRAVTVTDPDRAAGRPTLASSFDPTTLADYRPLRADDVNSVTRWSAGAGGTQWIRVDLGTTYNLSKVRLNWEGAYASGYKVQVSDDLVTWRDAATVSNGDGGWDEIVAGTNGTGLAGNGRYVQVLCTAAPHGNYSLWDFEVYGNTDLALNRPTTASSFDPTTLADYRPLRADDGSGSSRWSAGQGGTQWLRVDLGGAYRLSRVKLNWEGAYASGYKIQVSSDANTWRDAAVVSGGDGGVDDIVTGLSGGGRYVQVLCTAAPHGNYSLWDFEVYGAPDLAFKAAATASSFDPTTLANYQPSQAVDGNGSTRWSAGAGGTQWLRVDLGSSFRLSRVKLNWEGAFASNYKIQVSDDQATWRDAFATTSGDGQLDDIGLTPGTNTTGRYVQVLCLGGSYGNYSLWNFEAYAG